MASCLSKKCFHEPISTAYACNHINLIPFLFSSPSLLSIFRASASAVFVTRSEPSVRTHLVWQRQPTQPLVAVLHPDPSCTALCSRHCKVSMCGRVRGEKCMQDYALTAWKKLLCCLMSPAAPVSCISCVRCCAREDNCSGATGGSAIPFFNCALYEWSHEVVI